MITSWPVPPVTLGVQAEADDGVIAGVERAEGVFAQDRAEGIDERFPVGCGCRELHPRHATRRYSPIMPPTRAFLRTRY
jgi:hypothetical protein